MKNKVIDTPYEFLSLPFPKRSLLPCAEPHTLAHAEHIFIYTALAAINPELTKTKPHDSMFVRREHTHALCGGKVFTDQYGPIRQSLAHTCTHVHTKPVLPVSLGQPL